ncbi:(deoxy)nucleoside triphosphate pyrophosphohydrolase [Bacillus sp. 31A1R]|uniref:8-oxo-dGTP diphosphatase n=1 Tax=Robertmurraya mangrovi TaxID=3098077 RepID=A0ABU5J3M1_9BACI|nr:(deoxy)nucleoside triphosphate pyrophosphohydrolase [Bacillus sp. 31A1R]MDZ5474014.1 (deoxy)nucleoside triphosphate pyrophosphohydrolase [Bacillus sp. 31A1R]
MKTIKVVGAVITYERGEILCALRSPKMSSPNVWEFPGGKIEKGESPEEALIREIQEELGCAIKVYEQIEDSKFAKEKFIINLLTYKAEIVQGEPRAKEHQELKWVTKQELSRLDWAPADLPTVKKIVDNW